MEVRFDGALGHQLHYHRQHCKTNVNINDPAKWIAQSANALRSLSSSIASLSPALALLLFIFNCLTMKWIYVWLVCSLLDEIHQIERIFYASSLCQLHAAQRDLIGAANLWSILCQKWDDWSQFWDGQFENSWWVLITSSVTITDLNWVRNWAQRASEPHTTTTKLQRQQRKLCKISWCDSCCVWIYSVSFRFCQNRLLDERKREREIDRDMMVRTFRCFYAGAFSICGCFQFAHSLHFQYRYFSFPLHCW